MSFLERMSLGMIAFLIVAASAVGAWQYRVDLYDATTEANSTIPGCISGKYACHVTHFKRGKPVVEMERMEARQ